MPKKAGAAATPAAGGAALACGNAECGKALAPPLLQLCLHVRMHSSMHVRLRARVCLVYRHIPMARGAHARACKHAVTRMRTAV